MSYDIDVLVTETIHTSNYTSNLSKMYYEAYAKIKPHFRELIENAFLDYSSEDFKPALNAEREVSVLILKAIIEELENNKDHYSQYTVANGWGTYEGSVKFLKDAYTHLVNTENSYLCISS